MRLDLARVRRWGGGLAAAALAAWLAAPPVPAADEKAPAAQPAAAPQPAAPEPPLIEPAARDAVKRMVQALGDARTMSFEYESMYDALQDDGELLEFGSRGEVTIRRPDGLRGEVWHRDGRHVRYAWDGQKLAILGVTQNVYASTPRTGDIDSIVDFMRDDIRLKMPVADLFTSDLRQLLIENVIAARYIGKERFGDDDEDEMEHVALRLRVGVDVQLWIRAKDGLPQRVVLNYATAEGRPSFRGEFDDWELNERVSDSEFVMNAPKGARVLPFAIRPRPDTATIEPEDNQ
jgi:hypothetical protein